jgi:hypothetical protein
MITATLLLVMSAAPVDLEVFDAALLPLPAGAVVRNENPKVLATSDAGQGQLLLQARAVGDTRLTITSGKVKVVHEVHVRPSVREQKFAEIRALLGPVDGLTLGFERNGTPWAECESCDPEALARVNQVLLFYTPILMVNYVTPPRNAVAVMKGVVAILGEQATDTPGLRIDVREGRAVLFGELRTEEDRRKVDLASLRFPSLRVHVDPRLRPLSADN